MTGVNQDIMYSSSCLNTFSRCEPRCTAFATTFLTTPLGYVFADSSVETVSELGRRACAATYEGYPQVVCPGSNGATGGTFEAPTGCSRRSNI